MAQSDPVAARAPELDRLAEAVARVGERMATALGRPDQNLCVSPTSATLGLLMLLPGARGQTRAELLRALGPNGSCVEDALAAVAAALDRLRAAKGIELLSAQDVWPQSGYPVLPAFLGTLRRGFGAEVQVLDFAGDAAAARRAINARIAAATHDRIRDLVSADDVTTATRLVLTNALYFKAHWQHPFPSSHTHAEAFHLTATDRIEVPTMHETLQLDRAEYDGVQIARLPYVDPSFAFDVALPPEGQPVTVAERALGREAWLRWQPRLAPVRTELAMPKVHVEGRFDLKPVLAALALRTLTDPATADLSGVDGGAGRLFVDAAVQQVFLDVDEQGTEAAAATTYGVRAGASTRPQPLLVDRPFAFALRDTRTGLVLFCGHVADPRGRAATGR